MTSRRRPRRYGWWLAAAVLTVAIGAGGSALAAHKLASSDDQRSALAFHSAAVQIAAVVQLGLQRDGDLDVAAGAFIANHPQPTESEFLSWSRALQLHSRYPELTGLTWIELVPRAQLRAFETSSATNGLSTTGTGGKFRIVPAGVRPYYCLIALSVSRGSAVRTQGHDDYCAGDPVLLAIRAAGRTLASATRLPNGLAALGLATPIYRGGVVPATVSARERLFLGWTGVAVLPHVLLGEALRGRRDTGLVLWRRQSGSTLTFMAGRAPRDPQTATVNLHDGSTLEVLGVEAGTGILTDTAALVLLVGGIIVSGLLGMLVLVMATGRSRAMRLVAERTRELADEARLSASARDDAVQASNAKSVFVATVSHELRTPLAGVIGTAELLADTRLDSEQQGFVQIVRSSSEGLLLVINDILDFSKLEAGKLELDPVGFAPSELIAECCALVLPSARDKALKLRVEIEPDVPDWLVGDASRLRQVLINLLSNAIKFTPEGEVTVRASATPAPADMSVLRVTVTDTGIGIDAKTRARLFQPFTQADNSTSRKYGGTGLGLTISARLIERMGGTISAESVPGEGSSFCFEVGLPLADRGDKTVHAPAKFEALGERDAAGNLSDDAPLVLVAEDNPVNQMLATRLLDRCGYRSEIVADGNQALEASAHTAYAAILMDCQMPELDGYDATRAIRSRETPPAHLPIIATTAHSMTGDREKCLAAGMDDYISKPIRADELSGALTRLIGRPPEQGQAAVPATVGSEVG